MQKMGFVQKSETSWVLVSLLGGSGLGSKASIIIHGLRKCWKMTPAAAAAAKSRQSCPTLQPHRRQPRRLPHPWDSPGKNTGVGCHFLLRCRKVKSESEVTQSCPTLSDLTPWTAAYQAPLSVGFSRQEHRSGLPLSSPRWHLDNVKLRK